MPLFDARYWERAEDEDAAARAQAAVVRVVLPDGVRAWVITRHAEARAALADPRLLKGHEQLTRVYRQQRAAAGQTTELSGMFGRHMTFQDGEEHRRVRGVVAGHLSQGRVDALAPTVHALVAELLDGLPAGEPVDLVQRLAVPLPLTVVCELLGVPREARADLRRWTEDLMTDDPAITNAATAEVSAYLEELLGDKRARPGEDLLSALTQPLPDGARLSPDEQLANALLLIVAGHETTTNALANAAYALLAHGGWAELAAHPELVPAAVVELLRFGSPVRNATYRYTAEPVTYGGITIPAHQIVLVSISSANRDPEQYPTPDLPDLRRAVLRHLAFGHGAHYCIGAPLARLELIISLTAITSRWPRARLADVHAHTPPARRPSVVMNGLEALHVVLA